VKARLIGLLCLSALLVADCSASGRAVSDDMSRHWCVHELYRAIGEFFHP